MLRKVGGINFINAYKFTKGQTPQIVIGKTAAVYIWGFKPIFRKYFPPVAGETKNFLIDSSPFYPLVRLTDWSQTEILFFNNLAVLMRLLEHQTRRLACDLHGEIGAAVPGVNLAHAGKVQAGQRRAQRGNIA